MHSRRWRSAAVLTLAAATAGCGGAPAPTSSASSPSASGSGSPVPTTPTGSAQATTPTGSAHATTPAPINPPAASSGSAGVASTDAGVAVIRGWSSQLARGNVPGASTYFATPSVIQVDPNNPAVTLRTMADVRAANQAFPCGARLLSTRAVHGYIDALFLLGNRPGGGPGGCGTGTGLTARVAFVIRSGRIAEWRRIPDEQGDAAHRSPGAVVPPTAQPAGPGVSAV